MGCCEYYCMAISAFSVFFLLFLFMLVITESQTLYIQVHHPASTAVALFISALVYAGVFGYLYYKLFVDVDRKEELRKWIQQKKKVAELQEMDGRNKGIKRESNFN